VSLMDAVGTLSAVKTKLRAEHVNMVFSRDGNSILVLDNINLEVGEGEFLCLLGP
jgi:NitT/TauT family transport system ATP-binding protein